MITPRSVVAAAALVIVALTVAVGPLLGVAAPTTVERAPGDGTASVAVVAVPDDPRFERGQFGADAFYLRMSDATIDISDVEGRPVVYYELRIPRLGYALSSGSVMNEDVNGRIALTYESDTFLPEQLPEESYDGQVRIWTRTMDGIELLYERTVTVEVRR